MDYDGQRHSFQALQNSKKREEVKISRAKEQLEEAKRTFAVFNAELNEELPALYDSRLPFFITNMQTLFSAEQVFHSELSKVHGELESIIDKLAKESSGRTSSSHYRRSSPPTQILSSPASHSLNSPENGTFCLFFSPQISCWLFVLFQHLITGMVFSVSVCVLTPFNKACQWLIACVYHPFVFWCELLG